MNFPKVGDPLPNGYSVLANYRNKIIMAQSPCKATPQPYVVWHLSSTGDTWGGHYSNDLKTAEKWFATLCFDWLYDAMNEKAAPEAEIQERPQMGEKELYCLGWHFKTFFDQAADGEQADFGAPCATCKYSDSCGFKWDTMRQQLEAATGISIQLCRQRRAR